MKGTCFGPNWWRGYPVDYICELLYWHTTYECAPVGCITIFTSHLPTLPPSHSPPHSHQVMSTVTCVLKACVPNGAVAKQPPSTAIKTSLPSCTNRLTTVLVFAKPDPAPHHPISQAAQITKHLTTGMVTQLVKIPTGSLILFLVAFTHTCIFSLSHHRPTASPTSLELRTPRNVTSAK